MYRATVYEPGGGEAKRLFKGEPVGVLTFERATAERAWLSARSAADGDYPEGVTIKVSTIPKRIAGTAMMSEPELVYHRRWEGGRWIEIETGEPVE